MFLITYKGFLKLEEKTVDWNSVIKLRDLKRWWRDGLQIKIIK